MAEPNRVGADYYSGLDPYGGNEEDPAIIKMREVYDEYGPGENWLRERGYDPATVTDEDLAALWDEYRASEEARGMDPWQATGIQEKGDVAREANWWAQQGRDVLGMQRGSAAGINAARDQARATRQARVDLLDLIEGGRGDTVTPASQMAADSLLQQAAAARARGIDPSLAMTASAAAGRDMAGGAMGGRVAEGQGQMAALQEGAYGIRGGDLQRAGLEQQILEGDLAHQQAKEDLYLKYINEAQSLKETGRNAEVQLANIAAGGPASFDWGEALVPAALQAGSLGLLSLGSMGGGSPNQVGTVGHVANTGPAMQQSGYMAPDLDQYLANYKPYGSY